MPATFSVLEIHFSPFLLATFSKKYLQKTPIANDTIFDTMGIMSSGYLKPEDAVKLLMIGPEYTQVAIKTEKAVKHLRFIRSEKIKKMAGEALQMEQEDYQKSFAQEFEKIINQ